MNTNWSYEPFVPLMSFNSSYRYGYFDDTGAWKISDRCEYYTTGGWNKWCFIKSEVLEGRKRFRKINSVPDLNGSIFRYLKEGETVDRVKRIYEQGGIVCEKYLGGEKYVTYHLGEIRIERSNDNTKKGTFDFIRMSAGVIGDNKMQTVKDHFNEIVEGFLQILQNKRKYTRFNVPVNFLKVESAVLTKGGDLVVVFGLKELKEA